MCDCFHMVLPTWPGAPGSGAPPPRLQPAPLGRVGSAGGAGRAQRGRVGGASGTAGSRPAFSCLWPLLARFPPLPALPLTLSLTHLCHSPCRSLPLSVSVTDPLL